MRSPLNPTHRSTIAPDWCWTTTEAWWAALGVRQSARWRTGGEEAAVVPQAHAATSRVSTALAATTRAHTPLPPAGAHSYLIAWTGSIRDARSAGSRPLTALTATASTIAATPM